MKFRNNNKFRPLKLATTEHLQLINDLAAAKGEKTKALDYKLSTFKYRKKILKIKNFIKRCWFFVCVMNLLGNLNKKLIT